MANARVTRPLGRNGAFMQDVRDVVASETVDRLQPVCRAAEQAFDDIVRSEFVNDRAPDRRKTGRHLLGSSNCRVDWNGVSFPIRLSIGSTAEGKKLGALNYGSPPHEIRGTPLLVFPATTVKGKGGFTAASQRGVNPLTGQALRVAKRTGAYGKNRRGSATIAAGKVAHPGNRPHMMLERALERAVQAAYKVSLSLRRR